MKSCAFSVPNCTQTRGKIRKIRAKFNLSPYVKYSSPSTDFHKTRKCLIALGADPPTPNFTKIRQETRNLQINVNLRPYVKYGCQRADFRRTHTCFTNYGRTTTKSANQPNALAPDTSSRAGGRTWSIKGVLIRCRVIFPFCCRDHTKHMLLCVGRMQVLHARNCLVRVAVTEL
jgi:hypothetical protein